MKLSSLPPGVTDRMIEDQCRFEDMDDDEFRAFLNLLIISTRWTDKWDGLAPIYRYADRLAREWGYDNWVDAFHNHVG